MDERPIRPAGQAVLWAFAGRHAATGADPGEPLSQLEEFLINEVGGQINTDAGRPSGCAVACALSGCRCGAEDGPRQGTVAIARPRRASGGRAAVTRLTRGTHAGV
jgi:hypothetical protein